MAVLDSSPEYIICSERLISSRQTAISYCTVLLVVFIGVGLMFDPSVDFVSKSDIMMNNGRDEGVPILLALKGVVFDVSSEPRECAHLCNALPPPCAFDLAATLRHSVRAR